MDDKIRVTFASSISSLKELNSSFDTGVLQICYPGENRNKTNISKEDLIRCLPSMYNVPVVCNYDRDSDTLGSHDMEIVRTESGGMKFVNLTQPIGVVPESAKSWFATVRDEDGVEREYLFTDALLWKRQEAYDKIKRDGIVSQSMELHVKDGERRDDGIYYIKDFEFTAFTLIGVEPCFEGASLTVDSDNYAAAGRDGAFELFSRNMAEMMADLKETFSMIGSSAGTSGGDDNIPTQTTTEEGGDRVLEDKMKLLEEFGKKDEDLDFSIEDMTLDELREKLAAFEDDEPDPDDPADPDPADPDPADPTDPTDPDDPADPDPDDKDPDDPDPDEPDADPDDDDKPEDDGDDDTAPVAPKSRVYELGSNLEHFMREAVAALGTVKDYWGDDVPAYYMIDYDAEAGMIYVEAREDWNVYGFKFSMDGDVVKIDVDSKTRMKLAFVAFEGDSPSVFGQIYSKIEEKISAAAEKVAAMETELEDLRKYKMEAEESAANEKREAILAQFPDLAGSAEFAALAEHAADYTPEVLEEKCYALRGRAAPAPKFALEKAPKMTVDKTANSGKPYGGVVEYYLGRSH